MPWVPGFYQSKPGMEGFVYDKNSLFCLPGQPLTFICFNSDPDGRLSNHYSASISDGRRCACNPTSAPKGKCRRIARPADAAPYRRALARPLRRPRRRPRTGGPVPGGLRQPDGCAA